MGVACAEPWMGGSGGRGERVLQRTARGFWGEVAWGQGVVASRGVLLACCMGLIGDMPVGDGFDVEDEGGDGGGRLKSNLGFCLGGGGC